MATVDSAATWFDITLAVKRIIGIDPGSRVTGYGIIEFSGQKLHYLHGGEIKPPQQEFMPRLGYLNREMGKVLSQFKPTSAAIEQVFVKVNVASALKLGHARGALIVACDAFGMEVAEYAPTQIKRCLTGAGRADKKQVQYMVRTLLSLRQALPLDVSDALAVAICHAHHDNNALLQAAAQ
ncbi:MAG: crossover junction endodeoxyribonuclease RuvC [Candidatus Porifericomitaceae bacterium WSBS_2022_MAG_OTU9]